MVLTISAFWILNETLSINDWLLLFNSNIIRGGGEGGDEGGNDGGIRGGGDGGGKGGNEGGILGNGEGGSKGGSEGGNKGGRLGEGKGKNGGIGGISGGGFGASCGGKGGGKGEYINGFCETTSIQTAKKLVVFVLKILYTSLRHGFWTHAFSKCKQSPAVVIPFESKSRL